MMLTNDRKSAQNRLPGAVLTAGGAVMLIIIGLRVFHNLPLHKDLILWDEAFYMFRGLTFFDKIPREWGPAYCLNYLILFFFNRDTVDLYYLNYKLLAIAGPVLIYIFLTRRNVHRAAALTLAAFFLFSRLNVASWPYVSHFCIVVLMLGLIIATCFKSNLVQWSVFSGTALVLSYARPEYYLVFLVFASILLLKGGVIKFKLLRAEFIALGLLAAAFAVSHLIMGFPPSGHGAVFGSGAYSRQVYAFGNHYAINVGQWEGVEHAWLNWEPIFSAQFEGSHSFFRTIASNWPEFFRHLGWNLLHYLEFSFRYWTDVLIPEQFIQRSLHWNFLIWAVLLGGLGFSGKWRIVWRNYGKALSGDRFVFALLILAIPSELSCMFLYPRDHYLLLQAPLVIYLAALFFRQREDKIKIGFLSYGWLAAVGLILLLIAPTGSRLQHYTEWNMRSETHNRMVVEELQEMEITGPCKLLEDEGGLSLFIQNPNITSVFPTDLNYEGSIADYIQKSDVKLIFVSYILETDPNLSEDEKWQALLSDPGNYSFRRQDLEGSETYLLIHESI